MMDRDLTFELVFELRRIFKSLETIQQLLGTHLDVLWPGVEDRPQPSGPPMAPSDPSDAELSSLLSDPSHPRQKGPSDV